MNERERSNVCMSRAAQQNFCPKIVLRTLWCGILLMLKELNRASEGFLSLFLVSSFFFRLTMRKLLIGIFIDTAAWRVSSLSLLCVNLSSLFPSPHIHTANSQLLFLYLSDSLYDSRMKSTAFLTTIMTINWIFEIISFYVDAPSTMFDIVNALQGVFIFLMFVCTPRPLELIKRWWKDRGSFKVLDNNNQQDDRRRPRNDIQMTSLSKQGTWCRPSSLYRIKTKHIFKSFSPIISPLIELCPWLAHCKAHSLV